MDGSASERQSRPATAHRGQGSGRSGRRWTASSLTLLWICVAWPAAPRSSTACVWATIVTPEAYEILRGRSAILAELFDFEVADDGGLRYFLLVERAWGKAAKLGRVVEIPGGRSDCDWSGVLGRRYLFVGFGEGRDHRSRRLEADSPWTLAEAQRTMRKLGKPRWVRADAVESRITQIRELAARLTEEGGPCPGPVSTEDLREPADDQPGPRNLAVVDEGGRKIGFLAVHWPRSRVRDGAPAIAALVGFKSRCALALRAELLCLGREPIALGGDMWVRRTPNTWVHVDPRAELQACERPAVRFRGRFQPYAFEIPTPPGATDTAEPAASR